ncbi:MAG: 6-bladed beta-propeller [bacterium]|nr:6-bladed beta-propeller [bacterium]
MTHLALRFLAICTTIAVLGPAIASESPQVSTIEPVKLWTAGDDDEDVFFGVISGLDVDEQGRVYVADRQLTEIKSFSASGEYLGVIGREGEGPGEYRRIGHVFIAGPDQIAVMQRMPGKIISLQPNGLPAAEIPLPEAYVSSPAYFFNGDRVGTGVALSARQLRRDGDNLSIVTSLALVDSEGVEIANLSERKVERHLDNFQVEEKSDAPVIWTVSSDGNIFVNDEFDAFAIRVYDSSGSQIDTIDLEYEHRRRNEDEMFENTPRMAVMSTDGERRDALGIPSSTDRDIQGIFARPGGEIWVLDAKGAFDQPEGILARFKVFNSDRKFSREVILSGEGNFHDDGIRIIDNRLFVLKGLRAAGLTERGDGDEEDTTPLSIVCFRLPE